MTDDLFDYGADIFYDLAHLAHLAHLDTLDYLRDTTPIRITHEAMDTLRRVSDRTGEEYDAILARLLADEDGG